MFLCTHTFLTVLECLPFDCFKESTAHKRGETACSTPYDRTIYHMLPDRYVRDSKMNITGATWWRSEGCWLGARAGLEPRRGVAATGGQDSSLSRNGRRGSGRRRTHNMLLRDMRRSDRRTPPSAEVFSYDSICAHDGGTNMDLPLTVG